ncbi:MAG: hypothetical protein ACO3UU_10890, partial [Minisyncoccia bacterium]
AKKYPDVYQSRGFGYWQWKPLILLDALSKLEEGDIVAYVDSGNSIINNLEFVFKKCEEDSIVLFDNRDGNMRGDTHRNREWTKRDCFVLMNCDEEQYYDSPQVDASYQFYKKTPEVISFLEQYRDYCSNDNIISDIPNITKDNLPEFKDHRHDQSILSLLAAKNNIQLLPEPSEWGNHLTRPYPQLFLHHRGTI